MVVGRPSVGVHDNSGALVFEKKKENGGVTNDQPRNMCVESPSEFKQWKTRRPFNMLTKVYSTVRKEIYLFPLFYFFIFLKN